MIRFWTSLLVLLLPVCGFADPLQRVGELLAEIDSLQGSFVQQVRDGAGQLVEESAGTLQVQRPGKFRWLTERPYPQQVIADGEVIWIYDPDLEQVTLHHQDALATTPAMLLTDPDALQQYTLVLRSGAQPYEWIELIPRQPRSGGFERLMIALDGEVLRKIVVEDSLGQQTTIELHDLSINLSLSEALFDFVPPAGVDVVGER